MFGITTNYGFTECPHDNAGLFHRVTREYETAHGTVIFEVGLYRVMFGWRVRGGRVYKAEGEFCESYDFDICCGNLALNIAMIFGTVLLAIHNHTKELEKGGNMEWLMSICTERKPIINDPNYSKFLSINNHEPAVVPVYQDQLDQWAIESLNKAFT